MRTSMQTDKRLELRLLVHRAVRFAEQPVEELGDGVRDREFGVHEAEHKRRKLGPNVQTMSRTNGLRDHLPEDDDLLLVSNETRER